MESVLGRYRNLTILVGVLFLQVLGLAVQVKRSGDADSTRLIRIWAVDAITPFERVLVWAQNGNRNLWHNYFYLRGVRAENRQLKEQIEQMRLEQVRLSEDAAQAHRLQSLLAFKEQVIAKTVPAQVIGSSGSDLSRSIYIDKGSNDGIAPDMPVITAGGIVGKVLRVYPATSLVLMINDQSSGVGAMLEKSRLQGVLRGTPTGEVILERVMSDEQVAPGETVLSSGGDQIFPKGFPVGTVSQVSPGKEMFLNIHVRPAADLNRLEEVLVVTEKQERGAVAEGTGRVRAADILAQRLPSVPDKPAPEAGKVPAGSAADASGATEQGSNGSVKPQGNGGTKPETATVAKPQPTAAGATSTKAAGAENPGVKPATAKVPGPKPASSLPAASTAAGATVENDVLKKVVQKGASGDAGANGVPGSTSASKAKPADSTAKPAAAPGKPSSDQSSPQPPAAEDNPH
jgi:rod shape-determining protein MreC